MKLKYQGKYVTLVAENAVDRRALRRLYTDLKFEKRLMRGAGGKHSGSSIDEVFLVLEDEDK